jgi:hypothetical protein
MFALLKPETANSALLNRNPPKKRKGYGRCKMNQNTSPRPLQKEKGVVRETPPLWWMFKSHPVPPCGFYSLKETAVVTKKWSISRKLLAQDGLSLDIVYPEPTVSTEGKCKQIFC